MAEAGETIGTTGARVSRQTPCYSTGFILCAIGIVAVDERVAVVVGTVTACTDFGAQRHSTVCRTGARALGRIAVGITTERTNRIEIAVGVVAVDEGVTVVVSEVRTQTRPFGDRRTTVFWAAARVLCTVAVTVSADDRCGILPCEIEVVLGCRLSSNVPVPGQGGQT